MQTTVQAHTPGPQLSLDDLAQKRCAELEDLYRKGSVPASMYTVNGALEGRMLAVKRLDKGPLADALRRFARSRTFVWGGKTFNAERDETGRGINRVELRGVLGRQNLFPFATRFDDSAIDGKRTIVLDYDLPENPPYIRKIHDEIRQVSPGIYLGPAMWKGARGKQTLLWFALDTGKR
jgi:hypothetical protein